MSGTPDEPPALDKAKSALARAKSLLEDNDLDDEANLNIRVDYNRLLDVAAIQASIAAAEALTRIAASIAPPESTSSEPTDDDVAAYAECWDTGDGTEGIADVIADYRERGWDVVPRRVGTD